MTVTQVQALLNTKSHISYFIPALSEHLYKALPQFYISLDSHFKGIFFKVLIYYTKNRYWLQISQGELHLIHIATM